MPSMPRQLPFEVAPTVRYHEIGDADSGRGLLKFRVKGTLSINERLAVQEVDDHDAIFLEMAALVQKIEQDPGPCTEPPSPGVIYMAVRELIFKMQQQQFPPLEGMEAFIAVKFTEDVQALSDRTTVNNERLIIRQATTLIRTRLNGCSDWTDDDTRELDSEKLIAEIAALWNREGMGGTTEVVDPAQQLQELEDALGKLREAVGSLPPNPITPPSTGDHEPHTQEHQSSARNNSETTALSTSRKPSNKRRSASS
jgi:hypothetical protein